MGDDEECRIGGPDHGEIFVGSNVGEYRKVSFPLQREPPVIGFGKYANKKVGDLTAEELSYLHTLTQDGRIRDHDVSDAIKAEFNRRYNAST